MRDSASSVAFFRDSAINCAMCNKAEFSTAYDLHAQSSSVEEGNVAEFRLEKTKAMSVLSALSDALVSSVPKDSEGFKALVSQLADLRESFNGLDKVGKELEQKAAKQGGLRCKHRHTVENKKGKVHKLDAKVSSVTMKKLEAMVNAMSPYLSQTSLPAPQTSQTSWISSWTAPGIKTVTCLTRRPAAQRHRD